MWSEVSSRAMSIWQALRRRISRKQRMTRPQVTRLTTMRAVKAEVMRENLRGNEQGGTEARPEEGARGGEDGNRRAEGVGSEATDKSKSQSSFDGSILLTEYAAFWAGMKGRAVVGELAPVCSFMKGRSVHP